MRLNFKNSNGLTLIEIIISFAILSIVLVSFLSLFTAGFTTIVTMGHKSQANIQAQEIMDRIYAESDFLNDTELRQDIVSILTELVPGSFEDFSTKIYQFDSTNTNTIVRFYVNPTPVNMLISGKLYYVITLRVYYKNFTRNIEISSPIIR